MVKSGKWSSCSGAIVPHTALSLHGSVGTPLLSVPTRWRSIHTQLLSVGVGRGCGRHLRQDLLRVEHLMRGEERKVEQL